MKTLFKSIVLLLAATVLSTTAQAQINGDLNHNDDIDVDDVTLLINGYLTGEKETIADTCIVDNSLIVGTWTNDKDDLIIGFNEDGHLGGFFEPINYSYKFFPFQGRILMYNEEGVYVGEWKVLDINDETLLAQYTDGEYVTLTRVKAVDLGLSVKWASTNIGAKTPEEYGDYFAWGETEPKDSYDWESYKWYGGSYNTVTKYCTKSSFGPVDNKMILDLEDDAAYARWGGTWRMPTLEECEELINKCEWTWTTQNGVEGRLVTGPNGNSIFLPAAGHFFNTSHDYEGTAGFYWTSSLSDNPNNTDSAYSMAFNSSDGNMHNYKYHRRYGQTVRAVCP